MSRVPEVISVFGSTGSIGVQALRIADQLGLKLHCIAAGSNIGLLVEQALRYRPSRIAIADARLLDELKHRIRAAGLEIDAAAGSDALSKMASDGESDRILNSIVGSAGLKISLSALESGTDLALANKESLVAAGELMRKTANCTGAEIIPVDSEHSAIWQCMWAARGSKIDELILTASGGPFRGRKDLDGITPDQALRHPNWSMGRKITVDSATMINKALEVVEAKWLFGVQHEKISIVIHPQSIVHSAVRFEDGSMIAQMGVPDMSLPIMAALAYPMRSNAPPDDMSRLELAEIGRLDFEEPDYETFPGAALGHKALKLGGLAPAVMSAANEVAVEAFLSKKISFAMIALICEEAMTSFKNASANELAQVMEADAWAREFVESRCAIWHSYHS